MHPGGKIFVDSTLIGRKVRRTDVEAYYIPATGLAGEMGVPDARQHAAARRAGRKNRLRPL